MKNGVRTTTNAINSLLADDGGNFSLCHGIAGNADCVMEIRRYEPSSIDEASIALRVAQYGIDHMPATTHHGRAELINI